MNWNHARILAFVIVWGLAVCSTHTASAQATDPCKLITQAAVSSAVGMSVGAGQPIGTTGCEWSSSIQSNAPKVGVTLVLSDAAVWGTMKTPLPGVAKTSTSGIGDDAFYTAVSTLTTLTVKKGKTVFTVRIYGVHEQSNQMAMEKTLAGNVLARL